jgi:hypothetical protein
MSTLLASSPSSSRTFVSFLLSLFSSFISASATTRPTLDQNTSSASSSSPLEPQAYSARANRLLLPIKILMVVVTSLLLLIIAICLAKSFYGKIKTKIMKSLSTRFHRRSSQQRSSVNLDNQESIDDHFEEEVDDFRRSSSTSMEVRVARSSFPSFSTNGPFSLLIPSMDNRIGFPEDEVATFSRDHERSCMILDAFFEDSVSQALFDLEAGEENPHSSNILSLVQETPSIDLHEQHQINNNPSRYSCFFHPSLTSSSSMHQQRREGLLTNSRTNSSSNNNRIFFAFNSSVNERESEVTDGELMMFPPPRQQSSLNWATSSSSQSPCNSCICARREPPPSYEEAMKQIQNKRHEDQHNTSSSSSKRIIKSFKHQNNNDHDHHNPKDASHNDKNQEVEEDQDTNDKNDPLAN